MKMKFTLLSGVLIGLAFVSNIAQAHPPFHRGWHGGVGVYFGSPFYYGPPPPYGYGYGYPYPYAYSPPPVIITQPPQPQVYIEQGSGNTTESVPAPSPSASTGNSQGYWYYCEQSDSYYPYVKECSAGWKQVTPTPPVSGTK